MKSVMQLDSGITNHGRQRCLHQSYVNVAGWRFSFLKEASVRTDPAQSNSVRCAFPDTYRTRATTLSSPTNERAARH
eukprot:scaffold268623_cov13-Prasinocladus_malaysianus.AAC.1